MDEIKRIGPPIPIAVRGPEYDLERGAQCDTFTSMAARLPGAG